MLSVKYFLRAVKTADFDFLYRLKVVCLKEYIEAIWGWDEAKQRRLFKDNFDLATSQIIVAFGRDIGQLSIVERQDEIFLSGIYILPGYQSLGLGSQIIRELLDSARANERPVRLQVLVSNPARALYERLGFSVIDKNDTHFILRAH